MAKPKARKHPSFGTVDRFHLIPPLRAGDSWPEVAATEEAFARESLRRGASEMEVADRLARRRHRALSAPPPDATDEQGFQPSRVTEPEPRAPDDMTLRLKYFHDQPPRQVGSLAHATRLTLHLDALSPPELTSPVDIVWRASGAYREMARNELDNLPDAVQRCFGKEPAARFTKYLAMRAAFYQAGYDHPAHDVFSQIRAAKLLGHDIGDGVHAKFADRLAGLDALLNKWSPGLAQRVGHEIKGADGFEPRYIAARQGQGSKAPSLSNHAFGMAIDIDAKGNPHIKDRDAIAALREATGYDFGKLFGEGFDGLAAVDRIAGIHLEAQAASERLQQWLRKWLPTYKGGYNAPCGDAEIDRNMRLLQTVLRFHKMAELERWRDHGIQSIPLSLAAAMGQLQFRWGACYKTTKDLMHFELVTHFDDDADAQRVALARKIGAPEEIPPDTAPRPLADLLDTIAR